MWKNVAILIIKEISIVSVKMLSALGGNPDISFGGLDVIELWVTSTSWHRLQAQDWRQVSTPSEDLPRLLLRLLLVIADKICRSSTMFVRLNKIGCVLGVSLARSLCYMKGLSLRNSCP